MGPLHQWVQGLQPWVGGDRLIGHGIRQVQRLTGRGAAKHRMDVGREMGHVWHHDHDVAGVQTGVVFEPAQHLVVQHLHLALGAVALHPLNAGVGGLALVLAFCRGAQVQDVRLQLMQLAGRLGLRGIDKSRHAGLWVVLEDIDQMQLVAHLLAPSGQQGMAIFGLTGCVGVGCVWEVLL